MRTLVKYNVNLIDVVVFLLIVQLQLHPIIPTGIRLYLNVTLSLLLFLFSLRINNFKIVNLNFFYWWLGFLLIALISILYTVSIDESIGRTLSLLSSLLFLGSVSQYVKTKQDINRIINYFLFGGIVLVLLFFLSNVSNIISGKVYELSFGMEYTYVSFQTLCIVIWKLAYRKGNIFIYSFLGLFILFMNLISGNKKVMIIPIVFTVVLLLFKNKNKIFRNLFLLFLIGILLLFIYRIVMENEFVYNVLGYRIEGLLNYFTGEGRVDGSTRTRFGLLDEAISVTKENPIIGIGLGAFRTINIYETYAHNNYFELLTGIGIVGLIAYYWIFIYLLISLFINMKKTRDSLLTLFSALIFSLLIHDLGTVSYYRIILTLFVCIAICYINILRKESKSIDPEGIISSKNL